MGNNENPDYKEEMEILIEVDEELYADKELAMKKVLLIVKTTRYEVEKKHYKEDGEKLHSLLALRGINYDRLKRSYDAHQYALKEITDGFKQLGIDYTIIQATGLEEDDLKSSNLENSNEDPETNNLIRMIKN